MITIILQISKPSLTYTFTLTLKVIFKIDLADTTLKVVTQQIKYILKSNICQKQYHKDIHVSSDDSWRTREQLSPKTVPCNRRALLNVTSPMSPTGAATMSLVLLFIHLSFLPSSLYLKQQSCGMPAPPSDWKKMPHHQSSCNINLRGWHEAGRVSHFRDKYRNENLSKHCLTWGRMAGET